MRFSKDILQQLDQAKITLFADRDARVTRSEMIEAAVRASLKNLDSLYEEIRLVRSES